MKELYNLVKRMKNGRKYIFLLILRSPFDALRTWMLAGLMRAVFVCLETKSSDRLVTICLIYGLLCALLFFYNGTVWSIYAAFSAKVEILLQRKLLDRILKLPLREVECSFSGEWMTRLNGDVQAAIMMMNGPLNMPHLVVAMINIILSVMLMFHSNIILLGATLLFIVPHLLMNHKVVLRRIPKLREEACKALAESTSTIKPLITEAESIRLYDASELLLKSCEKSSLKLMRTNMKIHMRNAISDVLMRLFGLGGYFAILLLGYEFIYNGRMEFSDVVYCFQIRGAILAGILMLIASINNIKSNAVCARRLNEILDESQQVK